MINRIGMSLLMWTSLIGFLFCSSVHAQEALKKNESVADSLSQECEVAKKSKSEEDFKKCFEGDLNNKKKALIKKFKDIRPLNDEMSPRSNIAPPQASSQVPVPQATAPVVTTPVQPVVRQPVQPMQPAPSPQPRVNPYSY